MNQDKKVGQILRRTEVLVLLGSWALIYMKSKRANSNSVSIPAHHQSPRSTHNNVPLTPPKKCSTNLYAPPKSSTKTILLISKKGLITPTYKIETCHLPNHMTLWLRGHVRKQIRNDISKMKPSNLTQW